MHSYSMNSPHSQQNNVREINDYSRLINGIINKTDTQIFSIGGGNPSHFNIIKTNQSLTTLTQLKLENRNETLYHQEPMSATLQGDKQQQLDLIQTMTIQPMDESATLNQQKHRNMSVMNTK